MYVAPIRMPRAPHPPDLVRNKLPRNVFETTGKENYLPARLWSISIARGTAAFLPAPGYSQGRDEPSTYNLHPRLRRKRITK